VGNPAGVLGEENRLTSSEPASTEIIVVGAGLAGATVAFVLGQQGRRVMLVDPRPSCPPVFKAEKIEPEQAQLLRKFGLLDHILPHVGRVREIWGGYDGRVFNIVPIEQYGIYYCDLVNVVRDHIPATVGRKIASVAHIGGSPDMQRVKLSSGEELTSRLVVLACGVSNELKAALGFRKQVIQKEQSVTFGFTIARPNGLPFPFDAVTYYPTNCAARIDYLSLFPIRDTMRANLFVHRSSTDPWIRQFINEPDHMLECSFPKLRRVIGEYRVVSKVETGRIDLYRMESGSRHGIVLIGDAFQNVCPSTSLGLSKIFTDVDVLCYDCIPLWLATPGMGEGKISNFYNHPRKRALDDFALHNATYRRRASTERSIRWRIHRLVRLYLPKRFGRPAHKPAPVAPPRE
jgi:2-polyprenyl-6-methoxyphenol hydroxylase-like FAD-dependent oxidoreductase